MSKQRPSSAIAGPVLTGETDSASSLPARYWQRRVFRNTYTRGGECIEVKRWSVKIQHAGTRRTFSLAARNRAGAAIEAQAIHQTILSQGWDAAASILPSGQRTRAARDAADAAVLPKTDIRYWSRRLLRRRHLSAAETPLAGEYSARVEHAGIGHYFPLGTSNERQAAARALEIYLAAVRDGWDAVYRRWPREVTVALHWADNPLAWTYASFPTITGHETAAEIGTPGAVQTRVAVVEPDTTVRRALAACVHRQSGFACSAMFSNAAEGLSGVARQKVHLALANQSLPDATAARFEDGLGRAAPRVPVVFYSLYEDSDQLFKATPGGATGYLLKRTSSDRLFEAIAGAAATGELSARAFASETRRYFQSVVDGLSAPAASSDVAKLTHREHDILNLLSKGYVDKEIAESLGISVWTVHGHLKKVFEKLGVHTRTEAAIKYLHK